MEEKELIHLCLKNNRKAQQELFEMFYGKFLTLVTRYVGDKDESKDVLQDGFIKIFNNLKKFKFEGSFCGWARRIMINTALDYVRKKKEFAFSLYEASECEQVFLQEEKDVFIDQNLFKDIPVDTFINLIGKLSPGYRVVFNMRVIEEYTHKEISQKLGITEGTSKSNYFKAKYKFKELLNNYIEKETH